MRGGSITVQPAVEPLRPRGQAIRHRVNGATLTSSTTSPWAMVLRGLASARNHMCGVAKTPHASEKPRPRRPTTPYLLVTEPSAMVRTLA